MNSRSILARGARVFFISFAAVATAVLEGCASSNTRMNGVWVDPAAGTRAPVNNVLVIGINRDSTARRIYEDAIVAQFAARGIKSQPSYNLLPELGPIPPPDIEMVVRNAGVNSVLVSRTMRVSTDIKVNGAIRDQPGCSMLGQAAGTAAVQSIRTGQPACKLDTEQLVLTLRKAGANLPQANLSKTMTRARA